MIPGMNSTDFSDVEGTVFCVDSSIFSDVDCSLFSNVASILMFVVGEISLDSKLIIRIKKYYNKNKYEN